MRIKLLVSMLQRLALTSWFAGGILLASMMSCDTTMVATDNRRSAEKTPLDLSLDSAEVMFLSPKAEGIVKRILHDVRSEKDIRIKIKGLRIISTVLISKTIDRPEELDYFASYLNEARTLATKNRDSVEWALCTVQLFRYRVIRKGWFGSDEKIGIKTDLARALRFLEKRKIKDGLCMGYRIMAQVLAYDNEAAGDVLRYQLLSLQTNDSTKYPALRARICNDIAFRYLTYFRQQSLAERFFLRAAELFRRTDDYLNYSSALINIALNTSSNDHKRLHYCRLAAQVAKSGNLPERESNAYLHMALTFQTTGLFDSALIYQKRSSEILPKKWKKYAKEIAYREASMARSYLGVGQAKKAVDLTSQYSTLIGGGSTPSGIEFNVELVTLARMYEALDDFKNLSRTQHRLLSLRDSLFSRERMIEIGRLESGYELELKNKELKVLQMSNELHEAETEREFWVRLLLIVTAVITTLGLLIVVKLLTQQNQLNQSLASQNATIEKQKQDLEISLQELQKAQVHVLTSEKMAMLGQFTAGVAHELNNPLNFISGGVSVLEEAAESAGQTVSGEERQILRNIRNGVDRAIAIVNSLRVFSNPRSEIGSDSQSDLTECINASLLVLQSKIRREGVNVVTHFTECAVQGHSGQLCQVFINLIDNAIHAVKDLPKGRKTIEIRSRTSRSMAFVEFHDSGVGIPDSIQSNLFQAFFTTKPTGQGIGLGLFICDTILRGIGGTITVSSQVGEGSTFTVQFMCPK